MVSAHPSLTTWFPMPATSCGLSVFPRSTCANLSPRLWCQEAGPSGGHQAVRVEPRGEAASLLRRSLRAPLSPPRHRDRSATGSPATWAPGFRRPASGPQGGNPSGGRAAQPATFWGGLSSISSVSGWGFRLILCSSLLLRWVPCPTPSILEVPAGPRAPQPDPGSHWTPRGDRGHSVQRGSGGQRGLWGCRAGFVLIPAGLLNTGCPHSS